MAYNLINHSDIYDPETVEYLNEEFARLKDNCYLDHAGATLYSKTQIENVANDLCSSIYGNPHSLGDASKLTLDIIDQIRFRILNHFHTNSDEYSVIFTSSATDSLKVLSNAFEFSLNGNKNGGNFVYIEDSHTSVLGMREIAVKKGARVHCLGHEEAFKIFKSVKNNPLINTNGNNSLFVYPAQCNFSGLKYPLDWIEKTRNNRALDSIVGYDRSEWFTLLDAASFVSTNDLNLSKYSPDFVCFSFYKIFGYPTGVGALLVKKSAESTLNKIYYGGGTVEISLSSEMFHSKRRVLHERFEDGTLSFLSIISLRHGFDILDKIPMEKITQHVFSLARYLHHSLLVLHHKNGSPIASLYADTDYETEETQGGIVAFNLLRPNGESIGFVEFLNVANLHGISVRTGCFCNPGACKRHLNLSKDKLMENYKAGHVCGDERDMIGGKPTGGIRVSFGYMSKISEVNFLLSVIKKAFLKGPEVTKIPDWWDLRERRIKVAKETGDNNLGDFNGADLEAVKNLENFNTGEKEVEDVLMERRNDSEETSTRLKRLFIYPVKSCASFEVKDSWIIGDKGLAYDREWMITTPTGVCLTQKQEIKLCLIKPSVKRAENLLELSYPGMPPIKIPLKNTSKELKERGEALCRSKICGHKVEGIDCGPDVSEWLSLTLGRPGLRLVKQNSEAKSGQVKMTPEIAFSSQAQYLLINESSIGWLAEKIPTDSGCNKNTILDRFRGNIIIDGSEPFEEMNWSNVRIGKAEFQVDGQCTRCQMICIDQNTGLKTVEPLRTLAEEFHGKMRFGIYLSRNTGKNVILKIGDKVFFQTK